MDYENIIHTLVDSFVVNKDEVMVRQMPTDNEKEIVLLIVANPEDTARLIGRKGIIADALREIMSIAGKTEGKRIFLKFESFDVQNEDED
ncbi:MAG: KH domain-containing protein [Bacilli bacterium]|nr:KH domain-containing protein [Bacilli bacterium]